MRYWISGFIVVAAGLMAWPALAQPPEDGPERGERGRGREMRQQMLEEFDKDGDGRLNDDERAAAREAMRERRGRGGPVGPPPRGERGPEGRGGPDGRRGPEGRRGPFGERRRGPGGPPDGDRGPEGRRGAEARGPEGRGPQAGDPVRRRGPMGGPPARNLEVLFVWFDIDGDNMLNRAEFAELSQFVRRHRPGPPPGPPGGPRIGRRGADGRPDGPPFGDGFRRGRFDGPPGPPRDREFGRRGRGPDGPPRGDRPLRHDGDGRERRERDGRGPRGDGPPDRPDRPDRPDAAPDEAV